MSTPVTVAAATQARRPAPLGAGVLRAARKIHLYFGLFIAPALLFFAFTGAVQTLSLHESAGRNYTPPSWLARMGQLHKDQNIIPRKPRPTGPAPQTPLQTGTPTMAGPGVPSTPAAPPRPPVTLASKQKQHLPEKIFFLLVSLGLFTSTLTGIFMAYRYERGKVLVTALLIAGVVIPLALLPF